MKRTFQVAGVQFRPTQEIAEAVKAMKVGDVLLLEAEPTNKFDPNAVKILYKENFDDENFTFLGYVPKKFSSEVSGLLEAGLPVYCRVDEVLPSGKPWEMIKVTISDEEEDDGLNNDLCGVPEDEGVNDLQKENE